MLSQLSSVQSNKLTTAQASDAFIIFVNGQKIVEDWVDPQYTLITFLREKLRLRGSKEGCSEGGCGSCTVLLSSINPSTETCRPFQAINACITPICSLYGCHILTVEGIAERDISCHTIQDSLVKSHGSQCGFCSPGIVMSMYALASSPSERSDKEQSTNIKDVKTALQGNLCRCTGLRPILDAFKDYKNLCSQVEIEDLCSSRKNELILEKPRLILNDHQEKQKAIQNLLEGFHTDWKNRAEGQKWRSIKFEGPKSRWFVPQTVQDAFRILRENPEAKIIAGSTELFRGIAGDENSTATLVYIGRIPELHSIERQDAGDDDQFAHIKLGAALTISEMVNTLKEDIRALPEWKTQSLRTIVQSMETFASTQIRNSATIGGSLLTSNKASDIQTFYQVFQCWAHRYDLNNEHLLSKKTKLSSQSGRTLLTHIEIPYTKKNELTWFYKISKRKYFDVAILNAAARVLLSDNQKFVHHLLFCFGGLAVDRFEVDFAFEQNVVTLDHQFLQGVQDSVLNELETNISTDEAQYSLTYISTLIKNLLKKFLLDTKVRAEARETSSKIGYESSLQEHFRSSQLFTVEENGNAHDLVGKSVVHAAAYKHTTGQAKYCDDTPKLENELAMVLVLSKKAHAKILKVDPSPALQIPGVVGYISHQDLQPERNIFGIVIDDEEIFASSQVTSYGQIIGGILANDRKTAKRAAKRVQIEYQDIEPLILTIEDSIKHASYYKDFGMHLKRISDENVQLQDCDHTLQGEMRVGSQAHFYLEPQGCIAIPKGEDDEMEIISATQNPNDVQGKIAVALGVPSNRIVVKVKRLGGGFGGKETRCLLVALPTAVAAQKFGRPVRCILDRETDMKISGKRHTFLSQYEIGFSAEGRLLCLKMKLYADGGNTLDISGGALERAIVNMDNAYNIPNFEIDGVVCKTNTASNTAFRGTGGPQGCLIIEGILDRIAHYLHADPISVRRLNMYVEGDVTPYGQPLINCTVRQCWEECLQRSGFYARQLQVEEFNKNNEFKKRAISMNPAHFGIAYTAVFLNQGAALVNIYRDGSVLITHGGVEIGQGLHTKMIQVATRELGIPADLIKITETSTDKVPNPTPTSASSSSDMIGMALLNACQELTKRLEPYRKTGESNEWKDVISRAYFDRVSLSATGFYKVPGIGWNSDRVGSPFNYFSVGAATTEVELDVLTGEFQIRRTDIVMDVGKSLNPAIDIGQIEGAYMQGVGFFTTEELITNKDGKLITLGPSSYKLPTFHSAPLEFYVSILPGSSNPKAIYSSKTVGEPPLLLSASVFYAIKDCIRSYRRSKNLSVDFRLDSPATIARITKALAE